MRKLFMVLVLIAGLLGVATIGYNHGQNASDKSWEHVVVEVREDLRKGAYYMALTNARACVLALDSAALRFVIEPTQDAMKELGARYMACEGHWELATEYLPEGDEEKASLLRESNFEFDQWGLLLEHLVRVRITLITAESLGRDEHVTHLREAMREDLNDMRFYRDRIDNVLYKAWQ